MLSEQFANIDAEGNLSEEGTMSTEAALSSSKVNLRPTQAQVDLHRLAREVYELLKREARLERERLGRNHYR